MGDQGSGTQNIGGIAVAIAALIGIPTAIVNTFDSLWLGLIVATILVIALTFCTAVGQKLTEKWAGPVADGIHCLSARLFSGYRRYYLRHAIEFEHRSFDVKGLSTQNTYTLELERIFVDLSLAPIAPHQVSGNPINDLPKALQSGRHSIWQYLQLQNGELPHLAVLGAPGSGKTTLMKYMALSLALKRKAKVSPDLPDLLPILLFLRDHAKAIAEQADYTLIKGIETEIAHLGRKPPVGWFEQTLKRGRSLILLDGLDEVGEPDLRRKVVAWVEKQLHAYGQMHAYGQNPFVITSRPFGYRDNPISGVTVLEVRPFTAPQVEHFVHNWYLANEIKSQQRDDAGVHRDARKGAVDLLSRLWSTPALSDLAVNPLLLTMIATVHRYRSSLPGRRVELYAEICEVFLGKRQQAKGLQLDLTPAQRQTVLEPLAFHMMRNRLREIDMAAAGKVIEDVLARVGTANAAGDFLTDTQNNSGLLIERENGIYAFAHLTFQEYLAAVHIQRHKLEQELSNQIADSWWHETIRLYAAQADASPIIEACLAGHPIEVPALVLAIECQEEAKEIAPGLRQRLNELLSEEFETMAPETSDAISEALLKLRLKRLIRIDDEHDIDGSLISNGEYQLFLDESGRFGKNHKPDHWIGERYPKGRAHDPILGVRHEDAEAFCGWLTVREEGAWTYRLPSVEEGNRTAPKGNPSAGYWALGEAGGGGDFVDAVEGGERKPLHLAHLACDLAQDHDLAHDLAHDFALARAGDIAFARVLTPSLARDLALDRALALARDIARDFARDRALAQDHDLALALARDFDFALIVVHDPSHGLLGILDSDLQPVCDQLCRIVDLLTDRDRKFPRESDNKTRKPLGTLCALATIYLTAFLFRSVSFQVIAGWPARTKKKYGIETFKVSADRCATITAAASTAIQQVQELHRRFKGKSDPFEGIRILRERAKPKSPPGEAAPRL